MIENKELSYIKKPNEPLQYSSKEEFEEMILEIARCKRDIIYFAEHYYRVNSLDKGLHVIKLYDIQREFLKFLVDNNKVICVSGRQQGKCVFKETQITIKNKKTNKIEILDVSAFYSRIQNKITA